MAKAVSSARAGRTTKKNGNGSSAETMTNTTPGIGATPRRSLSSVEESIRRRAYELFQEAGAQHGRDQEHWFRAEAEVRGKTA